MLHLNKRGLLQTAATLLLAAGLCAQTNTTPSTPAATVPSGTVPATNSSVAPGTTTPPVTTTSPAPVQAPAQSPAQPATSTAAGQTGSATPAPAQAEPSPQNAPGSSPAGSDQAGQPPSTEEGGTFVFRKSVEEVVLHATVVDDKQRLITDLPKSAF
ncbi:MAG: hypothetical protein H0X25_04985, partial [Acidobacteriales bacterium]|nr:hypothetical protein [Terriglobales bacterium]